MLRRERLSVDLVREQDLVPAAIGERQAALVLLLDFALDAAVHPGEHHVARLSPRLGLVEKRTEGCAGPFGSPHRLRQPGLAQGPG